MLFITKTPDIAATPFVHANRIIGGLAICQLNQEADVWTISKATRLLSSSDPDISKISMAQFLEFIYSVSDSE